MTLSERRRPAGMSSGMPDDGRRVAGAPRVAKSFGPALGLLLWLAFLPAPATGQHHGHGDEFGVPSSVSEGRVSFPALYVVNGGSHSIAVLNVSSLETVATIRLRDADYPYRASLSPDRGALAIAVPGVDLLDGHIGFGGGGGSIPGAILVLDAVTGATLAGRRLEEQCHGAVFSPDGTELWTVQPSGVVALAAKSLEPTRTATAGKQPVEVALSADGGRLGVTNWGSSDVTVIDRVTGRSVASIPVGTGPTAIRAGSDGRFWVASPSARSVASIDPTSPVTARRFALDFEPAAAALSPDGRVWVTDPAEGRAIVFDCKSGARTMVVTAGSGAHDVAFWEAGGLAFVCNARAGTVTAAKLDTGLHVKTLRVGKGPCGLAMRP